jgi:UDP-N-acetylmuramoyl-L-alanyl-D-glutamate--2,6-diaminopimelate ligase
VSGYESPDRVDSVAGAPRPQRVSACALADLGRLLGVAAAPVPAASRDVAATRGDAAVHGGAATSHGVAVTGVTHASDAVRPGDLFAALPGGRHHGAEFVGSAGSAGAAAVLTDPAGAPAAAEAGLPALVVPDPRAVLGDVAARIYGDPSIKLSVIGITGTAGKTSTAYLAAAGLRAAGRTPALLSTVETRLGDLVLDSVRTTPEATDLHAMLAVAAERGADSVAMEVSSHALALDRVGGIRFAVGGFANLGVDHLDFHGDAEAYFAAKALLFDGRCAAEVINADDPAIKSLIRTGTITFSAAGERTATWYATGVRADGYEQRFTAHGPDRAELPVRLAQPGAHNVANALLAIALLAAVGVDPRDAAAGVAACPGVPGRLERVGTGPVLGVVDYAHKPDAIVAVLAALRPVAEQRGGRLICVIGAGGERDTGKRPQMGAAAARAADLVIITDDNPRGEDPAAIRAEVLAGARGAPNGTGPREVPERRDAIDAAVRSAGPADVVAVLGKGHERGQEVAGGQVLPFDDRIELAAALARSGGSGGSAT